MNMVDKNLEKKNYKNSYQPVINQNQNLEKQNLSLHHPPRKKEKGQKVNL